MWGQPVRPPSGHVFRLDRARGPVWYAKYRLPDGRQVRKKLGSAWSGRGRPPAGYFTKRLAEDWLRQTLDEARRGTLPGMVRTGATFADAAAEFLRYAGQDRSCKPSTLREYRSAVNGRLVPAFGEVRIEDITPAMIERWRASLPPTLANRTKNKLLILLQGCFAVRRACGDSLPTLWRIEKHPQSASGDTEVFSPEEVMALVRAADNEQDAAIYLTAAFTGLRRGELLALRWRDVDFAGKAIRVRGSFAGGKLTTPKSGKVRSSRWRPTRLVVRADDGGVLGLRTPSAYFLHSSSANASVFEGVKRLSGPPRLEIPGSNPSRAAVKPMRGLYVATGWSRAAGRRRRRRRPRRASRSGPWSRRA
jgi:integrase